MNPLGLLALAYPDRVARRRPSESNRFTMSNGVGAQFFDKRDPLANEDFVVVAGVFVHMCTAWVCVFVCVCLMGPRTCVSIHDCVCVSEHKHTQAYTSMNAYAEGKGDGRARA